MDYKKNLGILFILTFFSIFWCVYNTFFRPEDPNKPHFMGYSLIEYPKKLQAFLPIIAKRFKNIQYDKYFDMWSLVHFIIYFISGLLIPNQYLFVIFLSISCEIFEYFAGYRCKMSDIFINFIGYFLGSLIKIDSLNIITDFLINNSNFTIYSIPFLAILLINLVVIRRKNWV